MRNLLCDCHADLKSKPHSAIEAELSGFCGVLADAKRRFLLQHRENIVGRDPASDVWVDVPGTSRRHARDTIDGNAVLLEDLGSKNGTTVGETPVEAGVSLRDGDRIRFGSVAGVYRTWSAGMSTETYSPLSRRKRRP